KESPPKTSLKQTHKVTGRLSHSLQLVDHWIEAQFPCFTTDSLPHAPVANTRPLFVYSFSQPHDRVEKVRSEFKSIASEPQSCRGTLKFGLKPFERIPPSSKPITDTRTGAIRFDPLVKKTSQQLPNFTE